MAMLKKTVSAAKAKIDRSPVKEYYAAERVEFETLSEQLAVMQSFIDFTRAQTPGDGNEYMRSLTRVTDLGYDVSKPYVLRALE